jgi:Carboxypeptidase regulatory-like domain
VTKLSGTVSVQGGGPARAAVVELHNSSGDVVDQVQVDDTGRFTYHLSPGTWHLRVWDSSGHRGEKDVTLSPDEDGVVDLDLDA